MRCVGAREAFLLTCSIIEPPVVYLLPPRCVRYYQEPADKDVSAERALPSTVNEERKKKTGLSETCEVKWVVFVQEERYRGWSVEQVSKSTCEPL